MPSRTLIWQQLHLRSEGQGKLWAVNQRLLRRLNPECDFLVIDNASPVDPMGFTEWNWGLCQLKRMSEEVPCLDGSPVGASAGAMVRYHESLGHFFHGHTYGLPVRDGPGRAHTLALKMAIAEGYDRACYIEADALFRRPVGPIMDAMTKPVGCQPRCAYGYLDWHVWPIASVPWIRDFDFIGRYDWKNRVGEPGGEPTGEAVYETIFGEHLEVIEMSGVRGDTIALTEDNFREHFPNGCDYVTHVSLACFARWLETSGHGDLAAGLF